MNLNVPYAKAALPSLMMYEGMSREEAESFILSNGFDGIESKSWASSSVIPASQSIGKAFGLTKEEIDEFTQEALGKTESTRVTDMMREAASRMRHDELSRISKDLVVDTMEHVHDNWVEGNTKHFFGKKATQEKQFQYMPLELIGWKEAKLDLQYIAPVAESVGLVVDENAIKRECNNRTLLMLEKCDPDHPVYARGQGELGMKQISHDSLQDFVMAGCNGYDEHWTPEMKEALSDPAFVESTIIPQLETKGFGIDKQVMADLDRKGADIFPGNDEHVQEIGE